MESIPVNAPDNISIIKPLGKGKSGYSYLAEMENRLVVYKLMHNEPCPYYSFKDNKVKLEVKAYEILKQIGIRIPRLISYDEDKAYLIKEYIEGKNGIEWLAFEAMDEEIISELFEMSFRLKGNKLNIDYFPPNFVIGQDGLYYIDYEVNPYDERWSLEKWGLYFWANRKGMAEYHKDGNWMHIIEDPDNGLPPKEPFEKTIKDWIVRFGFKKT
ncbi:MAG: hypothetical protein Q8933_19385 [Bacteroidota bacterium]|nr:hypothetical protein [Bacteroidota bacterium]MDP4192742.1 hypothetical protein [Bacteroidota bacterium]MDP4197557.1 hypothetical protein [Bacteroidota bacterium]